MKYTNQITREYLHARRPSSSSIFNFYLISFKSYDVVVADLEKHHQDGFVGVRFNPGLWPTNPALALEDLALSEAHEAAAAAAEAAAGANTAEGGSMDFAGNAEDGEGADGLRSGPDAEEEDLSERIGELDEFGRLRRIPPPQLALTAVSTDELPATLPGASSGGKMYAAGRLQGGSSALSMASKVTSYANLAAREQQQHQGGSGGMLMKSRGNMFHERHDYSQPTSLNYDGPGENPNESMFNDVGRALFKRAGELKMPVGFMCFKGFDLHATDILALVKTYPDTVRPHAHITSVPIFLSCHLSANETIHLLNALLYAFGLVWSSDDCVAIGRHAQTRVDGLFYAPPADNH